MKTERGEGARPPGADDDLYTYFRAVYGDLSGYVELRVKDPDNPKGLAAREHLELNTGLEPGGKFHDPIPDLVAAVRRLEEQHPGCNIYNGLATRRAIGCGKKTDLVATKVLWCDRDRYGEDPDDRDGKLAAIDLLGHPPSIMVASGGPGARHLYWLLEEPYFFNVEGERRERLSRFEATLRGLCAALDGDRNACDATRVLRPPSTTNHPDARKREAGRVAAPVRLLEVPR